MKTEITYVEVQLTYTVGSSKTSVHGQWEADKLVALAEFFVGCIKDIEAAKAAKPIATVVSETPKSDSPEFTEVEKNYRAFRETIEIPPENP